MSGDSGTRYCPRPHHLGGEVCGPWEGGSPPLDRFTDGSGWACPGIAPDGSACGYELRPSAEVDELRGELVIANRRWDRVAKDCRILTAEVVAGLSTAEHNMIAVAGLPECRCGLSLGGGDASGSFITHALAVLAAERLTPRPILEPQDRRVGLARS